MQSDLAYGSIMKKNSEVQGIVKHVVKYNITVKIGLNKHEQYYKKYFKIINKEKIKREVNKNRKKAAK